MAHPPGIMIRKEVEDLVAQKMKQHKGRAMPRLRDRASHPFTPEILAATVPPHVQTPQINYYGEEGDPLEHIQRQKASLLGQTNDDNHFAFLFPVTLEGVASRWLDSLRHQPNPWGISKKIYCTVHERTPTPKSVGTLDKLKQRNDESLGNFHTRFNKELGGIN